MPARPLFGRVVATAEHAYPAGLFAASHFHDHSYLTIILAGENDGTFAKRTEQLPAHRPQRIASQNASLPALCLAESLRRSFVNSLTNNARSTKKAIWCVVSHPPLPLRTV